MKSGVYEILCEANGKRYIGSSVAFKVRWGQHRSELRGGYHCNPHLQRCWDKYGEQSFAFNVLEKAPAAELFEAEQRWLDAHRPELNMTMSADAPMRGVTMSEEHKRKISAALKGKIGNRKGAKMAEEQKRKISAALKGKIGNRKGAKMPEAAKVAISKSLFGNTHKRGKPASEETKAKMRIAQRARRERERLGQ